MKTVISSILIVVIVGFIALVSIGSYRINVGSAPAGLQSTVSTSTMLSLASRTATSLIATSTCSSRIISTTDKQIMLTFSDYNNAAPTATFGVMQAASTTVAYDSGQYGCGLVKGWGDAATNITVTETR